MKDPHQRQPDHLEQRQKRHDQVWARGHVAEEVLEAAGLGFREPREHLVDPGLDRDLRVRQWNRRPLLRPIDHGLERPQQAEQIDLELGFEGLARHLGHAAVRPFPLGAAQRLALVEQLGRRLELLMLHQALDQRVTGILVFLALGRIGARHQHPRLDVNERRRHHQELPGDVEVELLHHLEVAQVLLGDEHDGDVVDVDFVLLDEVQQQVERSFEVRQPDRIRVQSGLKLDRRFHSKNGKRSYL